MFLSIGTELRRCWDELCCTGALPQNLSMALREYEWVKLDEAEVEGVHRDVQAEHSRAHAARLPFVVSTVRLGENVGAWRRAQATGGRSWQRLLWCWRHWRRLAESPAACRSRTSGVTQAIRALPRVEAVRRAYRLDLVVAGSWRHLAPLFTGARQGGRLGGRFVALSGLGPPLY